jgi:CRP/FNR family cyclic AMP-dependent transcriptional regulator
MTEREALKEHPFGEGLTDAQLDTLSAGARAEHLPRNTVIFREGAKADALYLIVRGRVVLEEQVPGRGKLQLEELGPGDLLGLSWLFPGSPWVLDARTAEETDVLVFEAAWVHECMTKDAVMGLAVAKHIIHQLYRRLERVRLQRHDVYRSQP